MHLKKCQRHKNPTAQKKGDPRPPYYLKSQYSHLTSNSDKRAKARYASADDEGVDLFGTFIGINRFRIREKARYVILQ